MAGPNYSEKANEILNAAELRMRQGGFDAVSYRDLAAVVGIKASSVHYHFPQKADLGRAVVERYTTKLLAFLGAPDDPTEFVETRIKRLCSAYQHALIHEEVPCLCCVLGAESLDLPAVVSQAVNHFFVQMIHWTATALLTGCEAQGDRDSSGSLPSDRQAAEVLAKHIIGTLQGTMITALTLQDPDVLTNAEPFLLRLVSSAIPTTPERQP